MSFGTILTRPRIDQHTRDGYWTGRIITDYLDEAAAATPGKVAELPATASGKIQKFRLRQMVGGTS